MENYVFFANDFVIYLFELINASFQMEQITAMSKLKSKQKIMEYYIVTLCIMIMKEFKALFRDWIKAQNQHRMEFRDIGLRIGKIKVYAQEIRKEIDQKMDEGGVMGRLKRILEKKPCYKTGGEEEKIVVTKR